MRAHTFQYLMLVDTKENVKKETSVRAAAQTKKSKMAKRSKNTKEKKSKNKLKYKLYIND